MSGDAPFRVRVSDDNHIGVEFSEEFLSLSPEEQVKAMETFFWQKNQESRSAFDVGEDTVKHEITIALAQGMLASLKRGEPVQIDGKINFNIEDLVTL